MNKKFTKDETIVIKGIAIVMMFMHHLFVFPDRIYGGELNNIFGNRLIQYFGYFGQLRVPIFLFLSGYGIYKSCKGKKANIFARIKKLYITYWKVFIIFVPIGYLFFNNQNQYCTDISICTKYNNFNLLQTINDFLGLSSYANGEWWFLKLYIFSILCFPLIKKFIDKKDTITNIFVCLMFGILIESVLPQIKDLQVMKKLSENFLLENLFCYAGKYTICFWMGMIFAKDNLLVKLSDLINDNIKLNVVLDIIIIFTLIYLRQIAIATCIDFIIVPVFIIICMDIVNRTKYLKKIFYYIGTESTNMWLIHSFFCYYFGVCAKIVVWPKWALLCLLVLIVMTYVASKTVKYFWNIVKDIQCWLKKEFIRRSKENIKKKNLPCEDFFFEK